MNFTIDDQKGDSNPAQLGSVAYTPPDQWSYGPQCTVCAIHPDVSQTTDGSWHDTSYHANDGGRSMQLQFTGTAVYVYNILANTPPPNSGTTGVTKLVFEMDGIEDDARSFLHEPSDSTDLMYNQLVYQRDGLDNTQHTLLISASTDVDSVILFDYAEYTFGDPEPSDVPSSTSTSTSSSSSTSSTSLASSTASSSSTATETTSSPISSSSSSLSMSLHSSSSSSSSSSSPDVPSSLHSTSMTTGTASQSVQNNTLFTTTIATNAVQSEAASDIPDVPVGLIAGATAGGIGTLAFLALALWLLCRRRKRKNLVETPRESMWGAQELKDSLSHTTMGGGDSDRFPPFTSTDAARNRTASRTALLSSEASADHSTQSLSSESGPPVSLIHIHELSDSDRVVSHNFTSPGMGAALRSSSILARGSSQRGVDNKSEDGHQWDGAPELPASTDTQSNASQLVGQEISLAPNRPLSAGNVALQAQLNALQQEVARLRDQQHIIGVEVPPPGYDYDRDGSRE